MTGDYSYSRRAARRRHRRARGERRVCDRACVHHKALWCSLRLRQVRYWPCRARGAQSGRVPCRPTMRLGGPRGARFRRRNSSRRCGGRRDSGRPARRPESGISTYRYRYRYRYRRGSRREARRRWSASSASAMSSTAPSWSVNAHAPRRRFRTYARSAPGAAAAVFRKRSRRAARPVCAMSGRVLNYSMPSARRAARVAGAARLRGGGHVPRRPPTRRRSFPSLNRTPHALQSALGPSGPLRHSGLLRPAVGARHARPRRARGRGRERLCTASGALSPRAPARVGSNPTGACRRARVQDPASASLLATRPPPGSRGPP